MLSRSSRRFIFASNAVKLNIPGGVKITFLRAMVKAGLNEITQKAVGKTEIWKMLERHSRVFVSNSMKLQSES